MPIYEYECANCGKRFEALRTLKDSDSEVECLRCGAKQTRRVFSVFGTGSRGGSCAPSGST